MNASSSLITSGSIPTVCVAGFANSCNLVTYADLINDSQWFDNLLIFDSTGSEKHIFLAFFHTAANTYQLRIYVDSEEVDPSPTNSDRPRILGSTILTFNGDGSRTIQPTADNPDLTINIPWNGGRTASMYRILFVSTTQFASEGHICQSLIDYCPTDPLKTSPKICGCSVSDVDSDGDGTPNCFDQCPNDPLKISQGACGCGTSDSDSDGDAAPNCLDLCPSNTIKIAPGTCGCGVADIDTDGDGIPNCLDLCPNDAAKIATGSCGCGSSDQDANTNGAPDCLDPTGATTPTAPTFDESQPKPIILLQAFQGRIVYKLQLSRGGKVTNDSVSSNRRNTTDLLLGLWKVRYSVEVGVGAQKVHSRWSAWRSFRVK